MEAKELRIGNYVYDNYREVYKLIVKSDFLNLDYRIEFDILKPIPLTEEILFKCGFEEDGQLFHNQIALYKNGVGGFNYNVNYFEHENLEEIEHLHQLQNLYCALTGTELEINL
jgi:hypothetical protein